MIGNYHSTQKYGKGGSSDMQINIPIPNIVEDAQTSRANVKDVMILGTESFSEKIDRPLDQSQSP